MKTPAVLTRMREHPDAPRWNHSARERLTDADVSAVREFEARLATERRPGHTGPPPAPILQRLAALVPRVAHFREHLGGGVDLARDWATLPTMSRETIALAAPLLVPDDADLAALIIYRTAGTTGHSLLVPHAPVAAACYQPLIAFAARRHGAKAAPTPDRVACFLVGAQARTVTYATTLPAWNGAGFAKLNLRATEWPRPDSARRYFDAMAPSLLTGDPISFSEMLRLQIDAAPAAIISTAVAMSPLLRRRLAAAFHCPVIDWYSLTETGPIGYLCPRAEAFHLLAPDLFVEIVDPEGRPVAPGARGEVTVSGGRNPFLPLLRYRTGDFARLDFDACPCGDPMPRLVDLEGRRPVLFRAHDGSLVNPVDISRVLREFPLVQHTFHQHADSACELSVRPIPGLSFDAEAIARALYALLGGVPLTVSVDPRLGDRPAGKATTFQSDLLLED